MQSKHIYIYILIIGLITIGCQKLVNDPGTSTDPEIQSDEGLNYWGGSYNDYGHAVVQTTDGGYAVVGSTYGTSEGDNLYLVKFDGSLNVEGTPLSYGGNSAAGSNAIVTTGNIAYTNYAKDIQQTPDGGYIAVGSTFNGTDYDVWVLKLGSDFTVTWEDTLKGTTTGNYNDFGNSIYQLESGDYIICGTTYDGTDNELTLWKVGNAGSHDLDDVTGADGPFYQLGDNSTEDRGSYVTQTSDGGFIVVGTVPTGIQLVKLQANGSVDTGFSTDGLHIVGSAGDEGIYVQQLENSDDYIVVGKTDGGAGSQSQVILKVIDNDVAADGADLYSRTMGGAYNDIPECVRETEGDGGFVVVGSKYEDGSMSQVWVTKLTSSLATVWDHTYGGDLDDFGNSIKQTTDGGYIITGSTMSYGNQSEIILLKLDNDGKIETLIGKLNASTGE